MLSIPFEMASSVPAACHFPNRPNRRKMLTRSQASRANQYAVARAKVTLALSQFAERGYTEDHDYVRFYVRLRDALSESEVLLHEALSILQEPALPTYILDPSVVILNHGSHIVRAGTAQGSAALKIVSLSRWGQRRRPYHEDMLMDVLNHKCLQSHGGHPNITRLLYLNAHGWWRDRPSWSGEDNNQFYQAIEWCEGGNLFAFNRGRIGRPVPTVVAARWMMQLASAVAFMHAHGIAHLDLSLDNILLDRVLPENASPEHMLQTVLKINDFGLSRNFQPGVVWGDWPKGVGKPGYLSPEQFRGQSFRPELVDVYALGVVFFILLTSQAPYSHDRTHGGPGPSVPYVEYILAGELHVVVNHRQLAHCVPTGALHLLSKMLCVEATRMSIDQVLTDPWLLDLQHGSGPKKRQRRM